MQLVSDAKDTLRRFEARTDDYRIKAWQLSVTDASRLSVGLKDREIGGVYAPPATNRIISGSLYLVWQDGKVSQGNVNSLVLRDMENRLKRMRATAYKEEFVIEMPEDAEPPTVEIHDPAVVALLAEDSAACFELLGSIAPALKNAETSFDGAAGATVASLSVANSKGLDRSVRSSAQTFSASADAVFGVGYRSRRRLDPARALEHLLWLDELLPSFHKVLEAPASGRRPVLLLPGAASSFLGHFVLSNLDGESVANRSSAWEEDDFGGELQVFDEAFSLGYDPTVDWMTRSYRMDGRGLMARSVSYIENGRLVSPIASLKAARQLSCVPTPVPSSSGLTIDAPDRTALRELLASLDDGVIVPGVLGMHTQDASRANYSLSVPSALVVKGGKIVGRCKAALAGNFFEDLRKGVRPVDSPLHDSAGLFFETGVNFQ